MERSLSKSGRAYIGATLLYACFLVNYPSHAIRIHKPILVVTLLLLAFFVYISTARSTEKIATQIRFVSTFIISMLVSISIDIADNIDLHRSWRNIIAVNNLGEFIEGTIIIGEVMLGGFIFVILFVVLCFIENFIAKLRSGRHRPDGEQRESVARSSGG